MLYRIFTNMQGSAPSEIAAQILISVAAVLVCLTVHEVCHGLAAYRLGDPTAKQMGRFSVNPMRHIDPVGGLMLLFIGFGWAKPVMVDARYFKNQKRDMALVAAAGPLSNFIMAFLAIGLLKLTISLAGYPEEIFEIIHLIPMTPDMTGMSMYIVIQLLITMAILNLGLAVFNLIPVPPLDGSKILGAFLPDRLYWTLMRYERYGMFILLILLMFGRVNLGSLIQRVYEAMLGVWV
jgi:Zn-dependent protease